MLRLLIALTLASASFAYAETPEDGLGPYKFDASLSEVKATAANADWKVERTPDGAEILSGGPKVVLVGARFTPSMTFEKDKLKYIGLFGSAAAPCSTAIPSVVTALEPEFGIFSSAPGPSELRGVVSVSTTQGGSELRTYTPRDGSPATYSTRRGRMLMEVRGTTATNVTECDVRIMFQRATPYDGPLGSATQEEIDSAQTINGQMSTWAKTPTGRSFVSAYPKRALDRGQSGVAVLNCIGRPNGRLGCLVSAEEPEGWGFGGAALQIAKNFQAKSAPDVLGKRMRIPIIFGAGR